MHESIVRAVQSHPQAGKHIGYVSGELFEFHTPASQADQSNWQGPAPVLENVPAEGLVRFRWKAQDMSRRYAEVCRFMDFSGLVYGYLAMPNTTAGGAARCLTLNLAKMRPNAPITVGLVFSDTWKTMKTKVESHKDIAYAVDFLANNVFHATSVVAARLGRAVSSFKTSRGATASKLLWWTRSLTT